MVTYSRRFPGWADQVRAARNWMEDLLTTHDGFRVPEDTVASAVLLVSEAATNSIRYTASGRGGTFTVWLHLRRYRITIDVDDEGCPAGGTIPFIRPITPMAQHGRGITLIDYLATAWGPLPHPRTGVTFTLTWATKDTRAA
ncbi:ATP-binding protein [Nocardiopsis mangrovi]|uniref:ATP-binding protein n=1 Tax=Nocardiopsis mangrovi TaxID=1179818 RepID=A0ABV9E5A5_9ACTN